MFAKVFVVAALACVASASIPIMTNPLSMTQRIAALQGTMSSKECVPCEEAMGHAIHTAAEAGLSARFCPLNLPLHYLLKLLQQVGWVPGWTKFARAIPFTSRLQRPQHPIFVS
jgi:hypothetical protein